MEKEVCFVIIIIIIVPMTTSHTQSQLNAFCLFELETCTLLWFFCTLWWNTKKLNSTSHLELAVVKKRKEKEKKVMTFFGIKRTLFIHSITGLLMRYFFFFSKEGNKHSVPNGVSANWCDRIRISAPKRNFHHGYYQKETLSFSLCENNKIKVWKDNIKACWTIQLISLTGLTVFNNISQVLFHTFFSQWSRNWWNVVWKCRTIQSTEQLYTLSLLACQHKLSCFYWALVINTGVNEIHFFSGVLLTFILCNFVTFISFFFFDFLENFLRRFLFLDTIWKCFFN